MSIISRGYGGASAASPPAIVLVGPPGAGKTTALAALRARQPTWRVIDEPLERAREFGVLDAVCRGTDPHAGLGMEMLMMYERSALAWALDASEQQVVFDGHTMFDCLVYAEVHRQRGIMDEGDVNTVMLTHERLMVPPWYKLSTLQHVFYLRADAETCRRRVATRDRVEERALEKTVFSSFVQQFDCAVERIGARIAVTTLDTGKLDASAVVDAILASPHCVGVSI